MVLVIENETLFEVFHILNTAVIFLLHKRKWFISSVTFHVLWYKYEH